MALKATIFKIDLSISDMDRGYYADHSLTIARHPSETDVRMMLRIIAFALNASEQLEFTKGLSDVEQPDIWQKNFTDEIELWIELGQPSEQRVKKGCNQAQLMKIFSYANQNFELWWQKDGNKLAMRDNLSVVSIQEIIGQQLADKITRHMQIQCMIQDSQLWLTMADETIEVPLTHYC